MGSEEKVKPTALINKTGRGPVKPVIYLLNEFTEVSKDL